MTKHRGMAFFVIMMLFALARAPRAESVMEAWRQSFGTNAFPIGLALDTNGTVFAVGYTPLLDAPPYEDWQIIAYSNAGSALWTNRFNGSNSEHDQPTAIAVDSAGNLLVTGAQNVEDPDCVTIKYSGDGTPLWTNYYDGGPDFSTAGLVLTADNSDNVLVAGSSANPTNYESDYVIIKYSPDGAPLWTNRFREPANTLDEPYAIATDLSGNVVVAGARFTIIKYSAIGLPLWTNQFRAPTNCYVYFSSLALDLDGNAFALGSSDCGGQQRQCVLIKYSPAGQALWTNRFDSWGGLMDLDPDQNVVIAATSIPKHVLTIKYSNLGIPLWTNVYGVADADLVSGIETDPVGNIIVTGMSGKDPNYNCTMIKYSSTGLPLWTNRTDFREPHSLAVDGTNAFFLLTLSYGFGHPTAAVVKYIPGPSPATLVSVRTNDAIQLTWSADPHSWRLEIQTNSSTSSLGTNWTPVPDSSGTNFFLFPLGTAPSAFFRLVYP